jgi:hypothetical protein
MGNMVMKPNIKDLVFLKELLEAGKEERWLMEAG